MAVFRIEKTRDYTVMSNHHLRDKSLSLKAKGRLSLMLSLPEEWDYTTKGLARICKDDVTASAPECGSWRTRLCDPPTGPQHKRSAWRYRVHDPGAAQTAGT